MAPTQPTQPTPPNPQNKKPKGNFGKIIGQLSATDRKFIRQNVDKIPPDKIAEVLQRNESAILNYIQREKLGNAYAELRSVAEKSTSQILKALRDSPLFATLRAQLMLDELRFFEDNWVNMVAQFNGDLMPSEEMELKELLILEILKNRESAAEKVRLEMKADLEKELRLERSLPSPDRQKIRDINEQIMQCHAASSSYIKNFKELCARAESMRKALHASRQDRVKSFEKSKVDFVGWLKALEDHSQKLRVAREMEIMKQAQEKERAKLYRNHKYANAEVGIPILNEDSVGD